MKHTQKMKQHYRQGDVLIERIAEMPKKRDRIGRESGRVVLAHGEVTGHHHSLCEPEVDLYSSPEEAGVTFLEVREAMAMLTHQEHATIPLERGTYRVTRQREYAPEAIRNVQD